MKQSSVDEILGCLWCLVALQAVQANIPWGGLLAAFLGGLCLLRGCLRSVSEEGSPRADRDS